MEINSLLFFLFKILIITSAFFVVTTLDPIKSILALIMTFIWTSALMIFFEIEFLAIIFIVVYVGAIAVLFLFVVMMLNIRIFEINEKFINYFPFSSLILISFFIEVYIIFFGDSKFQIQANFYKNWLESIFNISNTNLLGQILYTVYFPSFMLCGLILLIAMIASIILTENKKNDFSRKQNIFHQSSTQFLSQIKKLFVKMPQLDKISFATQIFWLLLTGGLLYWIILQWILPNISLILKMRNRMSKNLVSDIKSINNEAFEIIKQKETHATVFTKIFSQIIKKINSKINFHKELNSLNLIAGKEFSNTNILIYEKLISTFIISNLFKIKNKNA